MPSRNVIREFTKDSYYHVFNRGVEKREIFLDEEDYTVFLGLIKKYLSGESHNPKNRHRYARLDQDVELLAYCLMPNHFHLLLYQISDDGVVKLMRRLMTGYVMYFNNKYKRVGSLFQGTYKASRINADAYLHHISRYLHLNPQDYEQWPHSSLTYYFGKKATPVWLKPRRVLELFDNNRATYRQFLHDYHFTQHELSILKSQLANGIEP